MVVQVQLPRSLSSWFERRAGAPGARASRIRRRARGDRLRKHALRTAFVVQPLISLLILVGVGCSSNRFQVATDTRGRGGPDPDLNYPSGPRVPPTPVPTDPDGTGGVAAAPRGVNVLPPAPMITDDPLARNPNPNQTGAGNEPPMTRTPPPGAPGSRQDRAFDGPELAGRVVNRENRPQPGASVQIVDVARSRRIVAEVASGADGSFRVLNLEPGVQYELIGSATDGGRRLIGRVVAVPPDTGVIVPVDFEGPVSRSPLGHRLQVEDLAHQRPPRRPPTMNQDSVEVETAALLRAPVAAASVDPRREQTIARPSLASLASADGAQARPATPAGPASIPVAAAPSERISTYPAQGPALPEADVDRRSGGDAEPVPRERPSPTAGARGGEAGSLTVTGADGRAIPLRSFEGDFVLLDFFGGWCGPCRQVVPKLNSISARYADRGLKVVGIACENGDAREAMIRAEQARRELGIRYEVVSTSLDEPSPVRDFFHVDRYPTMVLLDPRGAVLFQGSGGDPQTARRLEEVIQAALSNAR